MKMTKAKLLSSFFIVGTLNTVPIYANQLEDADNVGTSINQTTISYPVHENSEIIWKTDDMGFEVSWRTVERLAKYLNSTEAQVILDTQSTLKDRDYSMVEDKVGLLSKGERYRTYILFREYRKFSDGLRLEVKIKSHDDVFYPWIFEIKITPTNYPEITPKY